MMIPNDIGDGLLLDIKQLKKNTVAIVHLATQPPGTLQQVTLRPDKVSRAGFLRLGETQGDEAMCWIHPDNVMVMEILGVVDLETSVVTPQELAA